MPGKHPLSQKEFDYIYSKVPRLTVEIIVASEKGVLLTLRDIEPCMGLWHLPGGTVRFGEQLTDAVKRIAARELGIKALDMRLVGYIEYPSHYEKGLDSPVGIAFQVTKFEGDIKSNSEAKAYNWFTSVPPEMHGDQGNFLLRNGFMQ